MFVIEGDCFFSVITYDLTVCLVEIPDQRIKQVIETELRQFFLLNLYNFIEKKFLPDVWRGGGVGQNRTGGEGGPKRLIFTRRPLWMAPNGHCMSKAALYIEHCFLVQRI